MRVSTRTGKKIKVSEEEKLTYWHELSKKVDFVIKIENENRFGVEVNFYTVPGSKPTEIKRSYGNIYEGLSHEGIDLIWITDGKGHRAMQRSLRDAYVIFPNIYNLGQASQYLAEDLLDLLCSEGR